MSNHPSAPHTDRPAPSTDRPTATYPTNPFAGWRDRTPTGQVPPIAASRPEQPSPSPHEAEPSIQDMGRPGILSRPSMRWHPSLMQLAIGAALVAALLGACNVAAIQAHRTARAYCHALVTSDWQAATRECRGTGSGTPLPEQVPSSPHTPSPSPSPAPTQPSSSPQDAPAWVTRDTGAPYSKDDPSASPLSLPRCTTAPSTPLPCLATVSPDSRRVVVLEEDASLTALVRR